MSFIEYSKENDHPQLPHRCRTCRKLFFSQTGSVKQRSDVGHQVWAIVNYLITANLKGVSSSQEAYLQCGPTPIKCLYVYRGRTNPQADYAQLLVRRTAPRWVCELKKFGILSRNREGSYVLD